LFISAVEIILLMQTRVDPMKDAIYVNGNRLPKRLPQKVYLALNKPKGFAANAKHYSLFWNILLGYFSPFF